MSQAPTSRLNRILLKLEIPALIIASAALLFSAFFPFDQTAIVTLILIVVSLTIFFAQYETSKPALRQIMPTVVLAALAAAGRIIFAVIPDFKPVSAICIVSGLVFGKRAGFMVGALAALVSNFFFGQGPWTAWQMYAWGMIGYLAGVFASHGLFKHQALLYGYGFFSAIFYGFLLNTWHIVGFLSPIAWQSALIVYGASFPFDIVHGLSTVAFLLIIYAPWRKKLERIKKKYDLG